MGSFFYELGRLAAPKVRKAKWVWQSLTGSEAEAIQAEYAVGRDLTGAVAADVHVDDDPEMARLLTEVGAGLAACVKNPHRRFAFQAFVSPQANAFALPGGFIWVTRTLIELCGSVDELAFILGHEMAHVMRKHAMDRMMAQSVVSAGLRAMPSGGLVRGQLGRMVLGLLDQGYSQDQEMDADLLGARLAHAAGYDPAAAARLLARLAARSEAELAMLAYFSTHPPFEKRIAQIERFAAGSRA